MPSMLAVYTTSTSIKLKFLDGFKPNSFNGGYDINRISLYSDNGLGGDFINIQSNNENITSTTFTVVDITEGLYYKFKVSATNILGEGPVSDVFVVYISDLPEVMAPVTTSVVGTMVLVEWE